MLTKKDLDAVGACLRPESAQVQVASVVLRGLLECARAWLTVREHAIAIADAAIDYDLGER